MIKGFQSFYYAKFMIRRYPRENVDIHQLQIQLFIGK